MSKPRTRQDHIDAWKRRQDKARRVLESQEQNHAAGTAWSVHRAPRHVPRVVAFHDTMRRQVALRAYREKTGQEPADVPASWQKPDLDSDLELGSKGDVVITDLRLYWMSDRKEGLGAAGADHELPEPTVTKLPPGPTWSGYTARPKRT